MVIYQRIEGTDLVRAYSDAGMMIEQDESKYRYSEAIDPIYMNRTYTETDEPIEEEEDYDPQEVLDIIFGE